MKRKELEGVLGGLCTFQKPKVHLEQYQTSAEIASIILHTIHTTYNDIHGKLVADLGCGCGTFLTGSILLGADFCIGFDIDDEALTVCQENISELDLEGKTGLVNDDVTDVDRVMKWSNVFDTIVMNPPFGTKRNDGIDIKFLRTAANLSIGSIYSMHKSSTREHILKVATEMNLKAEVLAQLRFDLPRTMKFHTKNSSDVEVDFIKFDHKVRKKR